MLLCAEHASNHVTIVFALPFPLLRSLQLKRRQIWGLVLTFSLGVLTISMSVVRFATIEVIYAWTNVCMLLFCTYADVQKGTNVDTVVLSMAELATAIIVVSLPSMRSFLRTGGFFSLHKKSHTSESRTTYGQRTPANGSQGFMRASRRGKHTVRIHSDEESGSEVELNSIGRKDVIYETRRVSVQFSQSQDDGSETVGKLS